MTTFMTSVIYQIDLTLSIKFYETYFISENISNKVDEHILIENQLSKLSLANCYNNLNRKYRSGIN